MNTLNVSDFVLHFENAIDEVKSGSLAAQTVFHDLPQWDSLAALSIIAMLDADYGVEMRADEIRSCRTIEDMFRIVSAKRS